MHEGLDDKIDDDTAQLISLFEIEQVGDYAYDLLDCSRLRKDILVDFVRHMHGAPGVLGVDMFGERMRLYMDERQSQPTENISD